jgi:predicted nucleic acid-binding protein
MVILDTNIIIDHSRLQKVDDESRLMKIAREKPKAVLAISILSIQELYEGKGTEVAKKNNTSLRR